MHCCGPFFSTILLPKRQTFLLDFSEPFLSLSGDHETETAPAELQYMLLLSNGRRASFEQLNPVSPIDLREFGEKIALHLGLAYLGKH